MFDQINDIDQILLSDNGRYVIVRTGGAYLIQYGVYASQGTPGYCTITLNPGGIEQGGKIPLSANKMVSGSIIKNILPGTIVTLHVGAQDNNTAISIPAVEGCINAYLTAVRIGNYEVERGGAD